MQSYTSVDRPMKHHTLLFGKKAQNASTPDIFITILQRMYFYRLRIHDPCPPNYMIDGLLTDWKAHNFVNPPFGNAPLWVQKAICQGKIGNHSVLLLPARLSNVWFYDILGHAESIVLWCNRFKFGGNFWNSAPFGLCTVEFGGTTLSRKGDAGHEDIILRNVPADAWRFDNVTTIDKIKAKISQHYGSTTECTLSTLPISGKAFLIIKDNYKESMIKLSDHLKVHPQVAIILLSPLSFEGQFRKDHDINSLVQHVAFLCPSTSFDADARGRCKSSSCIVCMGFSLVPYRGQEFQGMPRIMLAMYTKAGTFAD